MWYNDLRKSRKETQDFIEDGTLAVGFRKMSLHTWRLACQESHGVRELAVGVLKSPTARHRRVSIEGKGECLDCCNVHVSVPAHLCKRYITAEDTQAGALTGLISSSCSVLEGLFQLTVPHHSTCGRKAGQDLKAGA